MGSWDSTDLTAQQTRGTAQCTIAKGEKEKENRELCFGPQNSQVWYFRAGLLSLWDGERVCVGAAGQNKK